MEIARTPNRGEDGVAWWDAARQVAPVSKNSNIAWQSTQRNVRDPPVYLFVNEGDETG